jgi:hypothetical protein
VRRILRSGLEKSRYTVLNDIELPSGGGSVHIDHVVVSRAGIFAIESQHAQGWISGTEVQDRWRQHHLRRTTRFDNPLHRNTLQAEALQRLLDLPASRVHRIVVLVGHKGFKTAMPPNLLQPEKLIAFMRRQSAPLLSADRADAALKAIEDARIRTREGLPVRPLAVIQLSLVVVLCLGSYLAFRDEISALRIELARQQEIKEAPEKFHPDGRRKTEREIWEDSLVCAYSPDTGRCTCLQRDGTRARLADDECRALAERGSVLNQ